MKKRRTRNGYIFIVDKFRSKEYKTVLERDIALEDYLKKQKDLQDYYEKQRKALNERLLD
jgi:hypothetical protein